MRLHTLYNDYIRLKFHLSPEPTHGDMIMAFGHYEDDSAALFLLIIRRKPSQAGSPDYVRKILTMAQSQTGSPY